MSNDNDKCWVHHHIFIDLILHRSCFYDDKNFLERKDIFLDDKNYVVSMVILDVQVVYSMKNQHFSDLNGLKKLRQLLKQQ
jgi:hypothetical protein